jgi:Gelsolin repeat
MVSIAQIHNYHQGMLHPSGIYLLDFESLAFIWVGKNVPKS